MTPFHDLHDYMSLGRLSGLRLAPDGSWLAVTVSALAPDGRTFKPSIWRVDTGGGRPAARLTRSAEGEDSPAFLPDGSLVFLSSRPAGAQPGPPPGPEQGRGPDPAAQRALWLLPAAGGEACRVVAPVLEEIASERPDLRIVKLDIDENPQTAARFQVLSIPTMILFKAGQPVKTVVGAYPKKKLEQELEPALSAA